MLSKKHARQYAKDPSTWSFMPDAVEKKYDGWCNFLKKEDRSLSNGSIANLIYIDFESKKNIAAKAKDRAAMEKNQALMDWVMDKIGVPRRGGQLL